MVDETDVLREQPGKRSGLGGGDVKDDDQESRSALKKIGLLFNRRFPKIAAVIDEALGSEDFKHRIWAVESFFKHLLSRRSRWTTSPKNTALPKQKHARLSPEALNALSDQALLAKIEALLNEMPTDDGARADE